MIKMFKGLILLLCVFAFINEAHALPEGCTAKRSHTKIADFGKGAMPIAALTVSLFKRDWFGAALSQVLSHGLYPLNNLVEDKIGKKRPCGCDGAFPSGHMIMYASSSSYLHYRYGWKYGIPAYIATIAFAADRVNNKSHSWFDMVGTFVIVNFIVWLVTPRYEEQVKEQKCEGFCINEGKLKYYFSNQMELTPDVRVDRNNILAALDLKF